jgi:hypothetical protein
MRLRREFIYFSDVKWPDEEKIFGDGVKRRLVYFGRYKICGGENKIATTTTGVRRRAELYIFASE